MYSFASVEMITRCAAMNASLGECSVFGYAHLLSLVLNHHPVTDSDVQHATNMFVPFIGDVTGHQWLVADETNIKQ